MKKKLMVLSAVAALLLSFSATASAASNSKIPTAVSSSINTFLHCKSAMIPAVIFLFIAVLLLIFRKKLTAKLNRSTASHMLYAFCIFFGINGILCMAFALATDGVTWSDMMHQEIISGYPFPQFSDYLGTLRNAGAKFFFKSAESFSPFSLLLFFLVAQFMPSDLMLSESAVLYMQMTKNQTIMLTYLFLTLFLIVLSYRMSRVVLRRNGLTTRNEVLLFLLVVSFPVIYCIELGNIAALSFALVMFFLLFRDHEKLVLRELSLVAVGMSAAITPYTLLFALLLLKRKNKKSVLAFVRSAVCFVVLFIAPAFFTGFGNMLKYVENFFSMPTLGFVAGNASIANLLAFFGVESPVPMLILMFLMEIIALVCVFVLPETWQKMTAIVYIILNFAGVSANELYLFILIPFIFLMAEKQHKAIDWAYLLSFSLLITPIGEWYYFEKHTVEIIFHMFGTEYITTANDLFSIAAVQLLFVLIVCQTVSALKQKKTQSPA